MAEIPRSKNSSTKPSRASSMDSHSPRQRQASPSPSSAEPAQLLASSTPSTGHWKQVLELKHTGNTLGQERLHMRPGNSVRSSYHGPSTTWVSFLDELTESASSDSRHPSNPSYIGSSYSNGSANLQEVSRQCPKTGLEGMLNTSIQSPETYIISTRSSSACSGPWTALSMTWRTPSE